MNEIPFKNKIDPKTKAIIIIILLVLIGAIVGVLLSHISTSFVEQKVRKQDVLVQHYMRMFKDMYTLHTTIICINILLLIGLLGIYIDSFRKTQSSFMLGLLLFLGVLLVQSVVSLPVLHATLDFIRNIPGIFEILPNLFEMIALIILLYLSME